jgi:hypothetical protein
MGFLRKLLGWLSPQPTRAARKWVPDTNPIDVPAIAKALRLKEEGTRLGKAGVPVDDETALCGPERHAVLAIEQARTDYMEWGQLRLKSLNDELTRLDVRPAIAVATESASEFERLAAADLTTNAPAIRQLEEQASSMKNELARFRAEHRRVNVPHYLTGGQKALAWVVAVSLIVLEALLNATFFAKGLAGGLIDGFAEAAIAATLNVLVCLALGATLLGLVHHVKIRLRIVGILVAVGTLCFIVGLALLVAHYREALVLGVDNAQSVAIQTFRAAPFALQQVSSWYLFLVGVLFGIMAVADGYKIDDPYPRYGKLHRRTMAAEENYHGAIAELNEHLSQLKETMLAKVDYALTHSAVAMVSFRNIISDKERCHDDLTNMVHDSPAMLNALLAEFRDENLVARKANGHRAPPSFSVMPPLHALNVPNFDVVADKDSLARQEALLGQFVAQAPVLRARIQSGFNDSFNSLQTLASHFEADNVGATQNSPAAMPAHAPAVGGAPA